MTGASRGGDGVLVLDLRPGWRHMRLAPVDGEVWDDEAIEGLEWFVARVLRGHRHHCRRWGQSLVVSIGPPDAPRHLELLDGALTRCLGALTPDEEEDLAARN